MAGSQGSPYRAPCGGWNAQLTGYPFSSHYQIADSVVPVYQNITKVQDYHRDSSNNPINSSGILPYASPESTGSCSGPLPSCGSYVANNTDPICNGLGASDFIGGTAPFYNTFSSSGTTANLAVCRKVGFKNVQAQKVWQGRFGFSSHDPGGCKHNITTCSPPCRMEGYQGTPDSTHYLIEKFHINYVHEVEFGTGITIGEQMTSDFTWSVNKNSGVATCTTHSFSFQQLDITIGSPTYGTLVTKTAADWGDYVITSPDAFFAKYLTENDPDCNGLFVNTNWYEGSDYGSYLAAMNGGTFTNLDLLIHSFANDEYEFKLQSTSVGIYGNAHTTWDIKKTLSSVYTSSQCYSDLVGLLGQWNLSDDRTYPWRTDSLTTLAPMVRYDEVYGVPNVSSVFVDNSTTVPPQGGGTGQLMGVPLAAGYGQPHETNPRGFYNRLHKNYADCGGGLFQADSYGDFTPSNLPSNCTEWTSEVERQSFPTGSWIINNSSVITAQKWAETIVQRPSINFARPCDVDRWTLKAGDPTTDTARCIDTDDGTTVVININEANLPTIAGGEWWIFPDGIYVASRVDDRTVARSGSMLYSAPPGMTSSSLVGKARWTQSGSVPPAFGGRVNVTGAVQSGANVIISVDTPIPILADSTYSHPDHIDFTGVGSLGANVAVLSIGSSTQFTVVGTLGAYTGGGYIICTGAKSYQWYDDKSKGDFVYMEWTQNMRDHREADRACSEAHNDCSGCGDAIAAMGLPSGVSCVTDGGTWRSDLRFAQANAGVGKEISRDVTALTIVDSCIGYNPCSPSVVAITPNGETFPKGSVYAFPSSFTLDQRYGAQWNAVIYQNLADPYWEKPHHYCYSDYGNSHWIQDDGTCHEDYLTSAPNLYYYAHAPMVEVMTSAKFLAIGAPTMPSDICPLGWPSLATIAAGAASPYCNFPSVPIAVGTVALETPWGLYANQHACVLANGRFAVQYKANDA